MSASDPQVIFMVLILPSLFGFTLIGDGLNKIMKSDKAGWASIIMGVMFIVVVIGAYVMISGI
jgi:4-amino-4-deoxy-L-arabinose transferase-like glycosyltransferase